MEKSLISSVYPQSFLFDFLPAVSYLLMSSSMEKLLLLSNGTNVITGVGITKNTTV
jgi:hypothetical protein